MPKLQLLVRKTACVAASLVLVAIAAIVPQPAQASGHRGDCNTNTNIKVALAPGEPATHTIAGTLCKPRGYDHNRSIDILVHGATYNRSYWDFEYNSPQYSYAKKAVEDGRTVFFYDRLGNGKSSMLPSASVTMQADAYALHQIIQQFRKDHYKQVNVVGHSFGSMIAQLEASQYNDIDRLVVTGSLQSTGPVLVNGLIKSHQANQDAQFEGAGYDNGWLTSIPGTKGAFYNTATADPNVIAYDDAHEGVQSATQFGEGRTQRVLDPATNPIRNIRAPVLIVVGEQDGLYCGLALDCTNKQAILDFQKPYYANAKKLDVVTIPNSGHNINLHKGLSSEVKAINRWLK